MAPVLLTPAAGNHPVNFIAPGMLSKAIALHSNKVSTGGDYSTGAAQVILPRVVDQWKFTNNKHPAVSVAKQ